MILTITRGMSFRLTSGIKFRVSASCRNIWASGNFKATRGGIDKSNEKWRFLYRVSKRILLRILEAWNFRQRHQSEKEWDTQTFARVFYKKSFKPLKIHYVASVIHLKENYESVILTTLVILALNFIDPIKARQMEILRFSAVFQN